jgi:hypothetical protein
MPHCSDNAGLLYLVFTLENLLQDLDPNRRLNVKIHERFEPIFIKPSSHLLTNHYLVSNPVSGSFNVAFKTLPTVSFSLSFSQLRLRTVTCDCFWQARTWTSHYRVMAREIL